MNKIILAIPHSEGAYDKTGWVGDIQSSVHRWTDWFTDRLFSSPSDRVVSVIGSVSRFDTDLERLIDDPMDVNGQGIYYTIAPTTGATRDVTPNKRDALRNWHEYREQLVSEIEPYSLLIDCHSFPSDIAPDIDICIGVNETIDRPSQEILDVMVDHFKAHDLRVVINKPFSNSIAPNTYVPYSSVMIEVNKALYMNEETLKEYVSSYKVHNILLSLYTKLLREIA